MKNKIFKVLIIAILSANVVYAESSRKIRISDVPMSKIEEDYKKLGDREDLFIKDKNGVYKYSYGDTAQKLNGIDPKTVEVFNKFYLKDKNGVYYFDVFRLDELNPNKVFAKVKGADTSSFVQLMFGYAKDKNKVYIEDREIKGADPESFKIIETSDGVTIRDKNKIYKEFKK